MPADPPTNPAGHLEFSTPSNAGYLSRLHAQGRAVKLASGIYVRDATLPAAALARHHLWTIVSRTWPGAVICDRSAFDGATGDWIFLCQPEPTRGSALLLPGISIICRTGPDPLPGDMTWLDQGLYMSGVARGLLENADIRGRTPKGRPPRAAGLAAVGDRIASLAADPAKITRTFAEIDQIRGYFDPAAVEHVRGMLASTQGTQQGSPPASLHLAAYVAGSPHDTGRLALFDTLRDQLADIPPLIRSVPQGAQQRWLPFFEAYFSNYIEGTRFSVEEAYSIAIDNEIPVGRPADAHDVSATYQIVNDPALMTHTPGDADDFLDILRARHAVLMTGRPETTPGQFKTKPNYAGATAFVAPELVEGTLREGWQRIAGITDPFHRAVMTMFVISECHPFIDGNGRIARMLTNAELAARGQHRILIPNSYRDNYLAALVAATNGNGVQALVSVLDFARRWASVIDWEDWDRCMTQLQHSNAFLDAGVAELNGQRLQLPIDI